jgi:hypothetical protein
MLTPSPIHSRRHFRFRLGVLAALTALVGLVHVVSPAPAKALVAECAEVHCGDGDGGEQGDPIWLPEEVIEIEDTKPSEDSGTNAGGLIFVGSSGEEVPKCGDGIHLCFPDDACATALATGAVTSGDWSCAEHLSAREPEPIPPAQSSMGLQRCPLATPNWGDRILPRLTHRTGKEWANLRRLQEWGQSIWDCKNLFTFDELQSCTVAFQDREALERRGEKVARLFKSYGWSQKTIDIYQRGLQPAINKLQAVLDEHQCETWLGQQPTT